MIIMCNIIIIYNFLICCHCVNILKINYNGLYSIVMDLNSAHYITRCSGFAYFHRTGVLLGLQMPTLFEIFHLCIVRGKTITRIVSELMAYASRRLRGIDEMTYSRCLVVSETIFWSLTNVDQGVITPQERRKTNEAAQVCGVIATSNIMVHFMVDSLTAEDLSQYRGHLSRSMVSLKQFCSECTLSVQRYATVT